MYRWVLEDTALWLHMLGESIDGVNKYPSPYREHCEDAYEAAAAARLRNQMRANGVRAVPRGPIAKTRANAAGLTRRQVQVLTLVDDGLSNSEIAARLSVSAKTAEHHVSAIMARLDAPTRQKAAAKARNLGLLGIPKR